MKSGMTFAHIGIPTTGKKFPTYIEGCKVWVNNPDEHPFAVEWLVFEEGSPMPEIIQKMPHAAYFVDDLQEAIKGEKVLVEPCVPCPGLLMAFIENDGVPMELLQKTN